MFQRDNGLWCEKIKVDGKTKMITAKSQKLLKQKLMDYKEKKAEILTVKEALDAWLAVKEKEVTYKTLEGYKAPMNRIRDQFGECNVEDITPAQIQAFINSLAARGYKRTTVQRPLDIMRMMFDHAITTPGSRLRSNPCTGVRLPKGLQQENRDLAPREAIEIVKSSLWHPFGLFPFFIMYSGLRDQEALAIRSDDIRDGKIHVNKAISWQSNQPVLKPTKTENGIRSVILLSPLADALPKFSGYLFSADGGKTPLTQTQFRHRWNAYCKDVGLAVCEIEKHYSPTNNRTYEKKSWHNTIVPYQLRHEFASLCFDADLDPADAADLMGHSSEILTRKWYTHIKDQRREKSADKLERFVSKVY